MFLFNSHVQQYVHLSLLKTISQSSIIYLKVVPSKIETTPRIFEKCEFSMQLNISQPMDSILHGQPIDWVAGSITAEGSRDVS